MTVLQPRSPNNRAPPPDIKRRSAGSQCSHRCLRLEPVVVVPIKHQFCGKTNRITIKLGERQNESQYTHTVLVHFNIHTSHTALVGARRPQKGAKWPGCAVCRRERDRVPAVHSRSRVSSVVNGSTWRPRRRARIGRCTGQVRHGSRGDTVEETKNPHKKGCKWPNLRSGFALPYRITQ